MRRRGFTLIEVLVVLGITMVLTSIILLYTGRGRDVVQLQVERAKFAQTVSRAKSLAVSTYNNPDVPCGYGVYVNYVDNSYETYSYNIPDCGEIVVIDRESASYSMIDGSRQKLGSGLSFENMASGIKSVFFLPPDPKTFIETNSEVKADSGMLTINSPSGNKITVTVSSGGQITF